MSAPAVLVVFRSHLRPEAAAAYAARASEIAALARTHPGLIAFKTFTADDGERVTIAEFDSMESEAAWREHPEHRRAQAEGRAQFYDSYALLVCAAPTVRAFSRTEDGHDPGH
jgi:heme-degrading monooxygenase HmoA